MISVKEVPYDEALPQLSVATNTTKMLRIFQEKILGISADDCERGFQAGTHQLSGCIIEKIKYKPGNNCMVSYRLAVSNRLTKQTENQIFYAKIYKNEEGNTSFKAASAKKLVRPRFGLPLSYISEMNMVVWAFPNDFKLMELERLSNPVYLRQEVLPEIIRGNFGCEWNIKDVKSDIVHYVPEQTCTVKIGLQLQHARSGHNQSPTFYAKTYDSEEGEEVYQRMLQLWESEARQRGILKMAQPLGYHAMSKSLWQLGLSGLTLIDLEMNNPRFLTYIGKAASTVGALHKSSISCSRSIHLSDLVIKLKEMKEFLPQIIPSCKAMLYSLIDDLTAQSDNLGEHINVTLHGDLHPKNFFVDGGEVFLIDMDDLCCGAPLQEIGSFAASIYYRGVITNVSGEMIHKIVERFINSYEKSVPWTLNRSDLKWYIATALVSERAFRCIKRLKAGRLDIVDDLIMLAHHISLQKEDAMLLDKIGNYSAKS